MVNLILYRRLRNVNYRGNIFVLFFKVFARSKAVGEFKFLIQHVCTPSDEPAVDQRTDNGAECENSNPEEIGEFCIKIMLFHTTSEKRQNSLCI